jgi:hypothetical protein
VRNLGCARVGPAGEVPATGTEKTFAAGAAMPIVSGVEETPLTALSPWPGNPRTIAAERLEQLKQALAADREMLHARPLLALPDGTVIAGNQRLRAARELGWATIPVVTVELDPERAAVARGRLAGFENVEALEGDCYELLRGPFGLVFADGGAYDWEFIVSLLEPGGILVKDDLTPGRAVDGDPVREFLFRDERLAAAEILTTPHTAAIVAVRR